MKLNISKPIIFFDLETTGIDIARDRIVELCYIRLEPNGEKMEKTLRFNPTIPIPEASSQVHGIYDSDVAQCPTFKDMAVELQGVFEGCDLAGFNSNHFDIPLLVEEFLRAGVNINFKDSRMVDVQNIYHKLEKRTLVAAYRFYCDKDLTDAHSALADTRATYEVLEAQLDKYPEDLQNDIDFLAGFSQRSRNIDFAGRVVYDENNVETINFGKYKGRTVKDIVLRDPGYFSWIQQGDFPLNTKLVFEQLRLKYAKR